MAWDNTMTILLRTIINDMDGSCYTDDRIKQLLAVGAYNVVTEIDFDTTYTVNITSPNISPDPTISNPVDNVFVNFVVLKTACIIDRGCLRTAALISGIEAKCGPAVMKTMSRTDAFKILIDSGNCGLYDELRHQYRFGNMDWCRGILSPFINEDFIPHYYDNQDIRVYQNQI